MNLKVDAKLLTQSVHFQENMDDRKFYIQTTITKADDLPPEIYNWFGS